MARRRGSTDGPLPVPYISSIIPRTVAELRTTADIASSSNPGTRRMTNMCASTFLKARNRPLGAGNARSLFSYTNAPKVANAGKLGESKAWNPVELTLFARLARNNLSLKQMHTSLNVVEAANITDEIIFLRASLYTSTIGIVDPNKMKVEK